MVIVAISLLAILAIIGPFSNIDADQTPSLGSKYVCVYEKHGTQYWETSFSDALEKAGDKQITLLKDVQLTSGVTITKDQKANINLNGHKIYGAGEALITNKGELHIVDVSDNNAVGCIYNTGTSSSSNAINNTGTLVIEGGVIGGDQQLNGQSNGNNLNGGAAIINQGGSVRIEGGHFTSGGGSYIIVNKNAGTITVNGNATKFGGANVGCISTDSGSVWINDGEFILSSSSSNTNGYLINVSGNGSVTIMGGTFENKLNNPLFCLDYEEGFSQPPFKIFGGVFKKSANVNHWFDEYHESVVFIYIGGGVFHGLKPKTVDTQDHNYHAVENPSSVFTIEPTDGNTVTLTFDPNHEGGTTTSETYGRYVPAAKRPTDPTYEGHIFKGWFKDKECTSGKEYKFDEVVQNITIYAKWISNEVTVKFVTNCEVPDPAPYVDQHVSYGEKATSPPDPSSTSADTFFGWYVDGGADGLVPFDFTKPIVDGLYPIVNDTLTITAGWMSSYQYSIKVGFDSGDGVFHETVVYRGRATPPTDPSSDTEPLFEGWYTEENQLFDFEDTEITQSFFLYAKWDTEYKIFFDGNGATGSMDDINMSYSHGGTLPLCTFEKDGCVFDKWTVVGAATTVVDGATIDSDNPLTDDYSVTLRAEWIHGYKVHFDGNGATSGSMADVIFTFDESHTLPSNGFVRDGHTFFYWTAPDGRKLSDQDIIPANNPLTTDKSITLTALWDQNYTIKFDGNGATSGSMADITLPRIGEGSLPSTCGYSKTGSEFKGWGDPNGNKYQPGILITSALTTDDSITLYAIWDSCEAKIGNTEYANLNLALDASKDGDTVTLMKKNIEKDVSNSTLIVSCYNISKSINLVGDSDNTKIKVKVPNVGGSVMLVSSASEAISVSISNIDMEVNGSSDSMCLCVGDNVGEMKIKNCSFSCHGYVNTSNFCGIIFHGTQIKTMKTTIDSSTIGVTDDSTGKFGTGILIDYQMNMDIIDTKINGRTCFDFKSTKPNTDSSTFNLKNCTLNSERNDAGYDSVIVFYEGANDISFNMLNCKVNTINNTDESYSILGTFDSGTVCVVNFSIIGCDITMNTSSKSKLYIVDDKTKFLGSKLMIGGKTNIDPVYKDVGDPTRFLDPNLFVTETVDSKYKTVKWKVNFYDGYDNIWTTSAVSYVGINSSGEPYGHLSKPADHPSKTGYKFVEWCTDKELKKPYDFSKDITKGFDLYPKFSDIFTIKFYTNGGQPVPKTQNLRYGDFVNEPSGAEVPIKDGYSLTGWYTESEFTHRYTFDTPVSKDLNLYAKWTPNKYIVVLDANGGVTPASDKFEVTMGEKYGSLPSSSQYGYVFEGWFTQLDGGVRITKDSIVGITHDHTLYAHWLPEKDESMDVTEDGSEVTTKYAVTKDEYNRTVVQIDSIVVRVDGTSDHTVSKSTKEDTSVGEKVTTKTVMTNMDSHGNTLYVTESTSVEIRTGNYIVKDTNAVEKDERGNLLRTITEKSTTKESMDGTIEVETTSTTVGSGTTVVTHMTTVTTNQFGSTKVVSTCVESTTSSVGTSTRTTASETIVTWTIKGRTENITEREVLRSVTGETTTTETISDIKIRFDEEVITITNESITTYSDSSSNSIIRTDSMVKSIQLSDDKREEQYTTESKYSDDTEILVNVLLLTKNGEQSTTSYAKTTIGESINSYVANVTLNYLDSTNTVTIGDVDYAYAQIKNIIERMGDDEKLYEKTIIIESGESIDVCVSPNAFAELSNIEVNLAINSSDADLTYDYNACRTFSKQSNDVDISLKFNDETAINDKQKERIGDSTFFSIVSKSGETYVSDINGSATISFIFDNPGDWKYFRAYYVDDEGKIDSVQTVFDESTGLIDVIITHQSIFAVLQDSIHNVVVTVSGKGNATASPMEGVIEGEIVTLTAIADDGYRFDGWLSPQVQIVDNTFVMPDCDVLVQAIFIEDLPSKNNNLMIIMIIVIAACIAAIISLVLIIKKRSF